MERYFTYTEKSPLLKRTLDLMAKVKDIESASSMLSWDQETYMPPGAVEARSHQITALEVIQHQFMTSTEAHDIAEKISTRIPNGDPNETSMFRLFMRRYNRDVKLPQSFIEDFSNAKTVAIESWKHARKESRFYHFEKDLGRLLELKIQEAEYLGYSDNRYDALLDQYEPGMTVAKLQPMFDHLKTKTLELFKKVDIYKDKVTDGFMKQKFHSEGQIKFVKIISEKMAFDLYYGRMDESVHPFTVAFSPKDVRITTRVNDKDIRTCIYASIHELGHGLYEQGIDYSLYRTFANDGASFGMHESQSLLWENMITRSREFFVWSLPILQSIYPGMLSDIYPTDIYKAVNVVRPSFIRLEADELTYNLHIILRFEIENMLLNGQLKVKEIPDYWNVKMREFLGIYPPNDTMGALQDIHWSHGGFGYFPTYTLGKMYGAMIWETMHKEISNLGELISKGNLSPLRHWLGEKIHRYGSLLTPQELIKNITGSELNEQPFLNYIETKLKDIYFN